MTKIGVETLASRYAADLDLWTGEPLPAKDWISKRKPWGGGKPDPLRKRYGPHWRLASEKTRETFRLWWLRHTLKQIAAATGVSEPTVGTRIGYAKLRIAARLNCAAK